MKFRRGRIPSHKAETCHCRAVLSHKLIDQRFIQKLAGILPEPWTVASRTSVGTARDVDCQGDLVGDLLADNIVTVAF